MSGFSFRVYRSETGRGWCYEIIAPGGEAICHGARLAKRTEVEDHARHICQRQNKLLRGINPYRWSVKRKKC